MTKDELVREVARKTGVMVEAVELVIDEFIGEIKAAVERGEAVTLNEFMRIFLRHKKDFRANSFTAKEGTGRRGCNVRERTTFKGGPVPWVKVSRKWRNEVMRGGNPDRPHPQPPQQPEKQMSIFDVIPKEE